MKNKLLSGLVIIFFLSIFTTSAIAASVYTDKADYNPGETVYISGYGFSSNSVVNIRILRPDGATDVCPMVGRCGSLYVTDGTGSFSNYAYVLDGILGTYTVTASDGTNTVSTTFTDAAVFSITITSPVAGSVSSPVRVFGTWSVSNNPPGLLTQYNVQIVWGDGNKDDVVNIDRNDNGQSGGSQVFSGTFDTQSIPGCSDGNDNCNAGTFDHTYSGCGPFTITVKLYHASLPGNEQTGDSSATVTITISNCQTTTTTSTTTSISTTSTTTSTSTTTTAPPPTTTSTTTTQTTTTIPGMKKVPSMSPAFFVLLLTALVTIGAKKIKV